MAVTMRTVLALLALCAVAACHVAHAYEEDYDDVSLVDEDVYDLDVYVSQARALSEEAEPEPETVLKPKGKHHHPRPHPGKHHPPQHGKQCCACPPKRKHHRTSRTKHHRGRVLSHGGDQPSVHVTQEVRDQWPGEHGKTYKRWEVVVVNTGHSPIHIKEIKCENFHPSQKWNIEPSGNKCKIPDWGQKIEPNKYFSFGYIGYKAGDFSYGGGGGGGHNHEGGHHHGGGHKYED